MFSIDDDGSTAFSWFEMAGVGSSLLSSAHADHGEHGTAVVALLPAFTAKPFISSHDARACSRILSAVVDRP